MQIKTHGARWSERGVALALAVLALAACANQPTAAVAAQPAHHRNGGFQNNYVDFEPRGLGALMRWRFDAWRTGVPAAPAAPTPAIVPDLGLIQSNARAGTRMVPTVTWIGHATVLVATHVPPWPRDIGTGRHPDGVWIAPWYVAQGLGEDLERVAAAHPAVEFRVLAGHDHARRPGTAVAPNLTCQVGRARYGHPALEQVIELGER